MEIKSKEILIVDPNSLQQYDRNTNKHTKEQLDRLDKLIREYGFREPLIVRKGTNIVICGNGRLQMAQEKGYHSVPIIEQEFKDDDEVYKFHISHNAIAKDSWAKLDYKKIHADLEAIGPFDIELLGIKEFTVEPLEKVDVEPEMPVFEYKLSVTCKNDDEMQMIANELTDRGFSVERGL